MKLGSLFSGSGGFELAGSLNRVEPVWCSEIEPYPIAVTRSRFPAMKHYGDVSKVSGAEVEPVDIITFGSPCFVAGTVVLTEKGYTPIEEICVGDYVLTHTGQMRRVTAVGSKLALTTTLRGNHFGVETTDEHPFYCAGMERTYPTRQNGKRTSVKTLTQERAWVPAKDMSGRQWATPNVFPCADIPFPTPTSAKQNDFPESSEALFYFVGRWLGDGWVLNSQRAGRPEGQKTGKVYLCDSVNKKNELETSLAFLGVPIGYEVHAGCVKASITHQLLAQWLEDQFGRGAGQKRIPSWALGMKKEYRHALLEGVLDSDGYRKDAKHCKISTISRALVFGLRALAESIGTYTTTVYQTVPAKTKTICGRVVAQSNYYTLSLTKLSTKKNTVLRDALHSWYLCRTVTPTGERRRVYNLSVDVDESYIADGIVVHNCQDLSIAGKREGIEDGARSSLFFQAVRIIKEMREATHGEYPRFAVWENVPGAFSSNKGNDFRLVLEALANVSEPEVSIPASEKWQRSGEIVGDGWSIAWRTLDAQYWGVPQRRKRIYLIADFGGERAGDILFKPDSLLRYPAQSHGAGQGTAADAQGGVGRSCDDGCLTPWDVQSRRVFDCNGKWPAIYGGEGGGHGYVITIHDKATRCQGGGDTRDNDGSGNGLGVPEEGVQYTLTGADRHGVAYAVSSFANYTAAEPTLRASGGDIGGGGSEALVVYSRQRSDELVENTVASCQSARQFKDATNLGAQFGGVRKYVVRRLTPTECARLQGFPDTWGELAPYDGDDAFWQEVYKTACGIKDAAYTPKKDLRKWHEKLHTDSAEYRMWGNGIALPCAEFVLRSIVDEMNPEAWIY